jgi:hypothetical protein
MGYSGLDKPYVVQLDGGIGRVICAIPAIEELAKKRRVIVLTSFPDVFLNNPHVYKTYNLNREYLWDDVIRHGEFLCPEPYFSHFYYNQEHHLIQSFNHLMTDNSNMAHANLYLSVEERKWAEEFVNLRRQEFKDRAIILFQCFGSGAILEDDRVVDTSHRSLPTYVVDAICANTNPLYINASQIHMNYPNVWQQSFSTRQLFALTAYCDYVVSVDSCLIHIGASFSKTGLVFFGGTFPDNLSYPSYRVIQREGYPKSYMPNRFTGFVDENQGALDFDNIELGQIIKLINDLDLVK